MIFYKLILLILVLILLIRLKLHLALSMLVISAVAVVLYNIEFKYIIYAARDVFLNPDNISIIFIIILVVYLSTLLSQKGNFMKTFKSLQEIFGDIRISLAMIPSLIGMVPMPAGALFSAPMVDEGGNLLNLKPYQKHLINYLFRHMWEISLPLYPGILLIHGTFRIPLSTIIKSQILYTIIYAVIAGCFIFIPIKVKKLELKSENKLKSIKNLLINFWPIFIIVISIIIIKININFIIFGTIIVYYLINKMKPVELWQIFKKSFSFSIISIIITVLFFKNLIQCSAVLKDLPVVMNGMGISPILILFFTPFLIGFLTGLTLAPVGIVFPILLPLFYKSPEVVDYSRIMLAYVGGYMGVNFSPTHLCLCLTKEYFKVTYKDIYKRLIPILLTFILVSVILYFLSYPPAYHIK